ncbi:MAG: choice-of-anchor J domain-containing protein [Brumimicrobium sp.]
MKYAFLIFIPFFCNISFSQDTLLFDSFDLGNSLDTWELINNDGFTPAPSVSEYTEAWILKEDPDSIGNGVVSSTSFFNPVNRADRWLITPLLLVGNESNYFSWKAKSHDSSFPDSYKVMISTTGNNITDFTDTLVVVSNELPFWTERQELLDDYVNQEIYIAFVNTTFDGFKLYLDDVYVRTNDPLSVKKESIQFDVYPNPTQDFIYVSSGTTQINHVSVINTLGEIVYSSTNESNNIKIDLRELNTGLYFINIETPEGNFTRKVLKN